MLRLVGVGTGLGVFAAGSAASPALAHEAALRCLGALDALAVGSGDAAQASSGGGVVVVGVGAGVRDVEKRLLLLGVGIVGSGGTCVGA